MDLLDLIITIAILAVGSFFAGGKKKSPAKNGNAAPVPQHEPMTSEIPWQQFVTVDEVEKKEKSESHKKNSQKSQTKESYFTYENQQIDWGKSNDSSSILPEELTVEKPVLAPVPFDLRQAFIYQTILQNDYISAMK